MSIELSPDQKLGLPPPKENSLNEIDTHHLFLSDRPTLSNYKAINSSEFTLKDSTALINPLGLLAFGITGFLTNLGQTGLYPNNSVIAALGIFYGGMGLLICGVMEWLKHSMAHGVTYISFGCFFIADIASMIFAKIGWFDPPDEICKGLMLFLFGFLLLVLFFVNLRHPVIVNVIYFTAFFSFWVQAFGLFLHRKETVSAWIGVICCSLAIYRAFSEMLTETFKHTILPLGPTVFKKKK